jgi:DNA-binding CsgD family transcriptional regulator
LVEAFDPIGLIEKSYEVHVDPQAWLAAMAPEIVPVLSPTWCAGAGYFFDAEASAATPDRRVLPAGIVTVTQRDSDGEALRQMLTGAFRSFASAEQIRRTVQAMRTPGIESLLDVIGEMPRLSVATSPVPLRDSAAVVVNAGPRVAIFCNLDAERVHLDGAKRRLWQRVAVHLGAGCRLSGRAASMTASDVEAVIVPGGDVTHAEGPGKEEDARVLLRAAAKDIDRARTRAGRSDPEAALELWQGLLAGRWSLVDHFDTDGRRFLLARHNDPDVAEPAALTPRERQVAFYASLGWSNEEVGYALGLASSTVSTHLGRGLTKLGLATREELVRVSTDLVVAAMQRP